MTDAEKRLRERVAQALFRHAVNTAGLPALTWDGGNEAARNEYRAIADHALTAFGLLPLASLAWAAEHPGILAALAEGTMVAAKAEALKPAMYALGNGYGVYFNPTGRFHGWMFEEGPRGEWISYRMIEPNHTPFNPALVAQPAPSGEAQEGK